MTDDWLIGANRGGLDKPSPKQTSATAKSLTLRCRLGFHHWHYDTFIVDGWFYAQPSCWRCGKEGKLITCRSIKAWFLFGDNFADRLSHQLKGEDYLGAKHD